MVLPTNLKALILRIQSHLQSLIDSFDQGNVIKNGVATVIAEKPNARKSTLLNSLLTEERAIVSEIPDTTRDTIEDEILLGGINFRFIDTAGLRETQDVIQAMGVERTREQIRKAPLILFLVGLCNTTEFEIAEQIRELSLLGIPYLLIGNKIDRANRGLMAKLATQGFIFISASNKTNLPLLKEKILEKIQVKEVTTADVMVTNLRHYENLRQTKESLTRVLTGMDSGVTGDFLAMDIRQALHYLGEITGTITIEVLYREMIFGSRSGSDRYKIQDEKQLVSLLT